MPYPQPYQQQYQQQPPKCERCGKPMIQKQTKDGRTFWSCPDWPQCRKATIDDVMNALRIIHKDIKEIKDRLATDNQKINSQIDSGESPTASSGDTPDDINSQFQEAGKF